MESASRVQSSSARRALSLAGVLSLVGAAAGTAVTATARRTDWGEILVNLSAYIGLASLLAALFLALARRWRWAALGACLTLYHAAPAAALYLSEPGAEFPRATERRSVPTLRLASANLNYRNVEPAGFLAWLNAERPDVLGLLEVTPFWEAVLTDVEGYPHRLEQPLGSGVFAMQLLSRYPLESTEVHCTQYAARVYLEADVDLGETSFHAVLVHPTRPGLGWGTADRNAYLMELASDVEWGPHSVLFGDFNATLWSPIYTDLLDATGLSDSRRGFGWLPSWRSDKHVSGVWLDLDHILVGAGLRVLEREVGSDIGSDHRPIQALLALPAGADPAQRAPLADRGAGRRVL